MKYTPKELIEKLAKLRTAENGIVIRETITYLTFCTEMKVDRKDGKMLCPQCEEEIKSTNWDYCPYCGQAIAH